MKTFNLICSFLIIVALLYGCDAPIESKSKNDLTRPEMPPESTIPPGQVTMPAKDPADLCKQLAEIKMFPGRDLSEPQDQIYDAVLTKGREAMPCLIDEITNETPMHDPRSAPVWQHYKVGDTAVFLLVDIAKDDELLADMLPPAHREEWKTNGVYAYFNYVSEPANRRELQKWWREWLTKH